MRASLERWLEISLTSPRAPWALAGAVGTLGIWLALDPAWLHDEGLLSYGFARAMGDAPLEMFFFQKCKPVFALLYALPARLGLAPFLVVHAVATATAVPLASSAARAMGARAPNVAALVVATSPLFLRAGGTGLSNADAVLAGAVVVWLAARDRPFAAGLALGASVWIRYETGVLAAVLFVAGLASPRLRPLVPGMLVFPAAYLAAGAAYHADLLWFVHFPPGITAPVAGMSVHTDPFRAHSAATLIHALVCVTPACAMLLAVLPRTLDPLPRALVAFVATFAVVFAATHTQILPIGPLFILGYSERYALALLPAVAPLAAIALDASRTPGHASRTALAAGLLGAGLVARVTHDDRVLLGAALTLGLTLAATRSRWPALGPLPLVGFLVAALVFTPRWLEGGGFRRDPRLSSYAALLERRADVLRGPLYTNAQLLSSYLARTGRLGTLEVRYLLGPDQRHELNVLASAAHGQRDRIAATLPRAVFGDFVDPSTLSPSELPAGTAFLLLRDDRLDTMLPEGTWGSWLEAVDEEDSATLYTVRASPPSDADTR